MEAGHGCIVGLVAYLERVDCAHFFQLSYQRDPGRSGHGRKLICGAGVFRVDVGVVGGSGRFWLVM